MAKNTHNARELNEQEGIGERQEVPLRLQNGCSVMEGTLLNPVFFPELVQLAQYDSNTGMGMEFSGYPMQLPMQFMVHPNYIPYPFATQPYASPFQMQFPAAAAPFPVPSDPVIRSHTAEKEVDDFLDTVLDSPTKIPVSAKKHTPSKRPRSPLPASTPKAPRAMREGLIPEPALQCYQCLAKDHTFMECSFNCPHCGKDGHRPTLCDYRTVMKAAPVERTLRRQKKAYNLRELSDANSQSLGRRGEGAWGGADLYRPRY